MSRSTWACELKWSMGVFWQRNSHVTLHVSVWVEIKLQENKMLYVRSRSTWACELKYRNVWFRQRTCGSRSTWACELKFSFSHTQRYSRQSRSTWACELKWNYLQFLHRLKCHAPRERVSWNANFYNSIGVNAKSRSTWACELKFIFLSRDFLVLRHAPRERVSWNLKLRTFRHSVWVTLHVSVWVEMSAVSSMPTAIPVTLHVSVWVEIGFGPESKIMRARHAPRERVSWNFLDDLSDEDLTVTLHVSVWVEIQRFTGYRKGKWSRSTWACELKSKKRCFVERYSGHAPRERVSWNRSGKMG